MEIAFNAINSIDNKKFRVNNLNKASKVQDFKSIGKDELEISSTAKDYSIATKNLKNVPDTRDNLVAKLKEKINSGNYEISPDKIATKIVNDWL